MTSRACNAGEVLHHKLAAVLPFGKRAGTSSPSVFRSAMILVDGLLDSRSGLLQGRRPARQPRQFDTPADIFAVLGRPFGAVGVVVHRRVISHAPSSCRRHHLPAERLKEVPMRSVSRGATNVTSASALGTETAKGRACPTQPTTPATPNARPVVARRRAEDAPAERPPIRYSASPRSWYAGESRSRVRAAAPMSPGSRIPRPATPPRPTPTPTGRARSAATPAQLGRARPPRARSPRK